MVEIFRDERASRSQLYFAVIYKSFGLDPPSSRRQPLNLSGFRQRSAEDPNRRTQKAGPIPSTTSKYSTPRNSMYRSCIPLWSPLPSYCVPSFIVLWFCPSLSCSFLALALHCYSLFYTRTSCLEGEAKRECQCDGLREKAHQFHQGPHAGYCTYGADDRYRRAEQNCLRSISICQLSADA